MSDMSDNENLEKKPKRTMTDAQREALKKGRELAKLNREAKLAETKKIEEKPVEKPVEVVETKPKRTRKPKEVKVVPAREPSPVREPSPEPIVETKPKRTRKPKEVKVVPALENMTFQKRENALQKEYNDELARSVKIIRDRAAASRVPAGGFKSDGALMSPKYKQTNKDISAMGENLALGAGFPLLFGGGAGSVLGSVLGSFVGTGFGGQILGGALGQALDQAVAAAACLLSMSLS